MIPLTIVIPTFNRAASLAETLGLLNQQDADPGAFNVMVVDNGSRDGTAEMVGSFRARFPLRLLSEPNREGYGKAHALNRALDGDPGGELIAVLDDDMSPDSGWVKGVLRASSRNAGHDLFSGRLRDLAGRALSRVGAQPPSTRLGLLGQ